MSEQEPKLIAVAKDFDKASGEIRKVSAAERQLADDTLKSGNASKEAAAAAKNVVDADNQQTKATEKTKFATSWSGGARTWHTKSWRCTSPAD